MRAVAANLRLDPEIALNPTAAWIAQDISNISLMDFIPTHFTALLTAAAAEFARSTVFKMHSQLHNSEAK